MSSSLRLLRGSCGLATSPFFRPEGLDCQLVDPLQRLLAPFSSSVTGFKFRRNLKDFAVLASDLYLDRSEGRLYLNDFAVKRDPLDFPIANAERGGLCE